MKPAAMKKKRLKLQIYLFCKSFPISGPKFKHEQWRKALRKRKNSHKVEKKKGNDSMVDPIGGLPDDLLVNIVSLLPIKEAAATSILSSRWKHVWKSRKSLNFDVQFLVQSCYARYSQLKRKEKDHESRRYVNWVDSVMGKHRAPTIEQFRVCFDIDSRFTASVDRWLEFAMNKKVQILELEFYCAYNPYEYYIFPQKLLEGLEKESASKINHCGFNFLKVLYFKHVGVTQQVTEYFLSNCPLLETLTVHSAENLLGLRVTRQSTSLKHLALLHCLNIKSIEICDTNLVSFSYAGGSNTDLILSNVPSLVELNYDVIYGSSIARLLSQLSCCISQLQSLMLDIYEADYDRNHLFPTFANLKHLELRAEAHCGRALGNLTSFLKASPYLQRLVLQLDKCGNRNLVGVCKETKGLQHIGSCPHYNLKVVEVKGYPGIFCDTQIVYLVKNAGSLEKITVDPVRHWWGIGNRDAEEIDSEVKARVRAMKHLKRKIPSTIEFVCM